jgi:TetR/AcrR family transcriptional regulator
MTKDNKTHRPDSRKRIIDAACVEFARYGLAGARIDRIARQAGVNKAMIYYHFASKENLYQNILEIHVAEIKDFFLENIPGEKEADRPFLKIADFYSTFFEKNSTLAPIILRELADGGKRIRKVFRGLKAFRPGPQIAGIIDRGIKEKAYRKIDIKQAIASFMGMNIFYLLMSPMVNTILDIEKQDQFIKKRPEAIIDLFLHGLKKRDG